MGAVWADTEQRNRRLESSQPWAGGAPRSPLRSDLLINSKAPFKMENVCLWHKADLSKAGPDVRFRA